MNENILKVIQALKDYSLNMLFCEYKLLEDNTILEIDLDNESIRMLSIKEYKEYFFDQFTTAYNFTKADIYKKDLKLLTTI